MRTSLAGGEGEWAEGIRNSRMQIIN